MDKNSHGSDWKDKQGNYSEACTYLFHIKNAWRNHTMHVHQQYDEPKAKSIMENTAKFMDKLAAIL